MSITRREALNTLLAGATLCKLPMPSAPLIGYWDLSDVAWDQVGAFNDAGDVIQGVRRAGEFKFAVLYEDDSVEREEGDDSNIIGFFEVAR